MLRINFRPLSAAVVIVAGLFALTLLGSGGCDNGKAPLPADPGSTETDIAIGPALPLKTPKPLDLAFIPPDAAFAMILDPHQLLDSQNFSLLSDSTFPTWLHTEMGIDPKKVEQAIIVGGLGKKLGEFFVGTILRYRDPVDEAQLLAAMSSGWEEAVDGDNKYHRSLEEGGRCVFFADKRTLLLADDGTLKKMLAVKGDAESPLLTTLRKSDDAPAALAILEVAIVRPQIMTLLLFSKLPAPFDKPPFDGVKELPKNIDEAIVRFDVSPLASLVVTGRAKTEEGAVTTDAFVANIVEKLGESVDAMTEDMDEQPSGGIAARGASTAIQEMYDGFKARFEHKVDGNEVKISYAGRPFQNQLIALGPTMLRPFQQSFTDAQAEHSRQNLTRSGAALDTALAANGSYPATASYDPQGKPLLSWRVHLLPHLGQQALYEEFHLDEPWDSEHNKKLIVRIPAVYRTPGQVFDGKTMYLLATGAGTVFDGPDGPKAETITDGKDSTILAVEVFDGRGEEWTKPADLKFDRADPTAKLTHLAKFKFHALFADGTAGTIDVKRNGKIVSGYFSPSGGEELPEAK